MKELTRKEEQIMLAVRRLGGDAYLISIREQIREFTGKSYSVGTIFAPLNRLEMNGYVASSTRSNRRLTGKKPIKFYTLTEKGRRSLAELQRIQNAMWRGILLTMEEG